MLIFGYGPRPPRDRGAAAPLECPNCHNLTWYHLVTVRTSVSFFFVPVIPVRTEDALVCTTCRNTFPLSRTDAAVAIDMVRATQRLRRHELDATEYGARADQFWERVAQRPGPAVTPDGDVLRAPSPTWATAEGPGGGPVGEPGSRPPEQPAPTPPQAEAPPVPPDPFAWTQGPMAGRPDESVPTPAATAGAEAPPPDPATRAPAPPPGWYPDPYAAQGERYWDGERWTRAGR